MDAAQQLGERNWSAVGPLSFPALRRGPRPESGNIRKLVFMMICAMRGAIACTI